jgi:hypothetical protein
MTNRILELAQAKAQAENFVNMLGMVNTPTDLNERIASDARYRLAVDAAMKADAEYREAISNLTPGELQELALNGGSGSNGGQVK